MNPVLPILCLILASLCKVSAESGVSPEPRSEERFAMLWERSPFVLSSVESLGDLAKRYSIAGVAMVDNQPRLFIRDNKDQRRYSLSEIENDDGMRLVRLEENEDPLKVRAVVVIGGREGTITYDPIALKTPSTPSPERTLPESLTNGSSPTLEAGSAPDNQIPNTIRPRRPMRVRTFPAPPSIPGGGELPAVPVIPREPISPNIEEPAEE